jgi:DNA-binding NarL/FixJ family response regulator
MAKESISKHETTVTMNTTKSVLPAKGAPAGPRKVLIVDDHPVVREGLQDCLRAEPDLTVCGMVATASEALIEIKRHKPDAAVLDLSLPDRAGLELIKDIRAENASTAILVFTNLDESIFALRALRAGAQGYLMKHESPTRLKEALRSVIRGAGPVVSQGVFSRHLQHFLHPEKQRPLSPVESLSDRDLQVFEYLGMGLNTREIAARLNRSVKTVETHYARVKKTLCLAGHSEMICHAVRWVERSSSVALDTMPVAGLGRG